MAPLRTLAVVSEQTSDGQPLSTRYFTITTQARRRNDRRARRWAGASSIPSRQSSLAALAAAGAHCCRRLGVCVDFDGI